MRAVLEATGATVELCGFGLVAAAARTSQLLANRAPQRVLLLGIAGALSQELEIGAAYSFQEVACFGVGAGSGQDFRSAAMMGWSHWPGPPRIDDCLPLEGPASGLQLLTCCSASGNSQDASLHLEAFPSAVAEDMEGFAVAAACRLASVPVQIIRGISNRAGDRNHARWQVASAMQAATDLALQLWNR